MCECQLKTERHYLLHALVEAWPAVKEATASSDTELLPAARAVVDEANVAFGERSPKWWGGGSPDYYRQKAINTHSLKEPLPNLQ